MACFRVLLCGSFLVLSTFGVPLKQSADISSESQVQEQEPIKIPLQSDKTSVKEHKAAFEAHKKSVEVHRAPPRAHEASIEEHIVPVEAHRVPADAHEVHEADEAVVRHASKEAKQMSNSANKNSQNPPDESKSIALKPVSKNYRKTLIPKTGHRVVIMNEEKLEVETESKQKELHFDANVERKMQNKAQDVELTKQLDSEIESYEEIKKRIAFLEDHLKKHADFHVVDTKELVNAANTLQDLKMRIIHPLESNLKAVRGQMESLKQTTSIEDKQMIHSVLDNAETFLKLSLKKIETLEDAEQDWESEEERERIRVALENKKQVAKPLNTEQMRMAKESLKGQEEELAMGLRSQRLQQVKKLISAKKALRIENKKKTAEAAVNIVHEKHVNIDLHKLKEDLDREKQMDAEPGYANKIKAALKQAAEKSHKFIHDKLSHGHPGDAPAGSLMIVSLAILATCMVMVIVIFILLKNGPSRMLRRKLFKPSDTSGGYCELNDVRGDVSSTAGVNHSWNDSAWRTWHSQKLK